VQPRHSIGLESDFQHEALAIERNPEAGLTAIVAVHSTVLGPAIGGLRILPYPSWSAAMVDALRLSEAMTLKTAAAGLPLGGGKAVLLQPPGGSDRRALMHAMGEMVNRLDGKFVIGEDIGTTPLDMDWIAERTESVTGRSPAEGGLGDPSPATARTVFGAMRQALGLVADSQDLTDRVVGIMGVGKVGGALAQLAAEAGARVILSDTDTERALEVGAFCGAEVVPVAGFLARPFDVFAPCAGGQVLNVESAGAVQCRVIAGAANNQLTEDAAAEILHSRDIMYVPDFVANCGGVIFNGAEYLKRDPGLIDHDLDAAVRRTGELLQAAVSANASPLTVARRAALDRISAARAGRERQSAAQP